MDQLPVIQSCDHCGACCREQQSPPGYAMLLSLKPELKEDDPFAEDLKRLQNLPTEAMDELRECLDRTLANDKPESLTCIWLNLETMQCRYHEHRPSICREFEVGTDDCLAWRQEYGIS